ncbi:MAG TPA: preprotein translocase subunit SecA [Candidatus Saccharimonadales bacterium]
MRKLLKKVFGSPEARALKSYEKRIEDVNALAAKYKKLSDTQLKAKTAEFKKLISEDKKTLDDILPEAFALVREASTRVLGQRHFDVQLIGGIAMHEGNVAEMKTGEGKTLVATLPIYLNALSGQGVHLVTVNDYLAQRDAGWMGGIYDFLGMTVSVIISQASYIYDTQHENTEHDDERLKHLRPITRQEAYAADITYGMNSEFGFDYLRDNMVQEAGQLRQRDLHYAIVDEVDSILIDEARTPLIISAPSSSSGSSYSLFSQVARRLEPKDYEVDEKRRAAALTDDGVDKVQQILGLDNLYTPENVQVIYHLEQALRAETLFKKDKDYVVTPDGEIVIVDEFTGRLLHGRRYNEGLHQAIEAKEGVDVQQESVTLATISYQNYFRLYKKLAGMTGTAKTEEQEFQEVYDLNVVEVPTNRPLIRDDRTDRIYATEKGKFTALVEDVKQLQKKGQPVLIGTVSIEKNEVVSKLLARAGVEHSVLNAKHHEQEATIVAKAGNKGAVTLATNIAGRGTDIKLSEEIQKLGGLVVAGSERHEARRIDNQLRGRGGRQGEPGMTQFYVSAEDDLMRIFGGDRIKNLMSRLGVDETTPIENNTLSKAIENAQKKVESHNFDARKNVVQYDDVMNRHRKATYVLRQEILKSQDISQHIYDLISEEAASITASYADKAKEFKKEMEAVIPLPNQQIKSITAAPAESRAQKAAEISLKSYKDRVKRLGQEAMRKLERALYLQALDTAWMQHLENMQHLREGITWRSIGQRDPLVEYRREGQSMFERMQEELRNNVVQFIFRAEPPDEPEEVVETELTRAAQSAVEGGAQPSASRQARRLRAAEPKSADVKVTVSSTDKPKSDKNRGQGSTKAQRKRKKKARRRK